MKLVGKVVAALLLGIGIFGLVIYGVIVADRLAASEAPGWDAGTGFAVALVSLCVGYGISQWTKGDMGGAA